MKGWLDRMWLKIKTWLNSLKPEPGPTPEPEPEPDPTPANGHRASFLFDKAIARVMNVLSPAYSDAAFRGIVERCQLNGDTLIYLYLANNGDGHGVTSFYANGGYGGAVDTNAVQAMQDRLKYIRGKGLGVIGWLTADDSPLQYRAALATHLAHVQNCVSLFGGTVQGWVIGLEMDSDGRNTHAAAMIAEGRRIDPVKQWGIHLNPGKTGPLQGAQALYYQISGFNPKTLARDVSAFEKEIKAVRAKLPAGVALIAAEYSGSSDSQNAKALGDAAMRGGANGTGNGRN